MKKIFKITGIFLLLSFFVVSGQSCTNRTSQQAQQLMQPVTLKFWSVYDDSDAFREIINDYRALHPNVSIEYRKLRYDEYEKELINAFALDQGPDIFAFHNTWTLRYQDLLEPMPAQVSLPVKRIVGGLKQEEVIELVSQNFYNTSQIVSNFGDTVAGDCLLNDEQGQARVYGLPLSLDTLALYYNKDILNKSGVALPPVYWTDLQAQIESIRRLDAEGNFIVAPAGLGTADNVVRSFDILSLLMLQLKTQMVDDRGQAFFDKIPPALSGQAGINQPPAHNALDFYTSFADPLRGSYSYNDEMEDSLNAFISGKTAYFIGYSYHRPIILTQAPKLNFNIAPMLQVQGYDKVNYANYWFYGASQKSDNKNWAWDFVRFMTTADEAQKYLQVTQKPTAQRSLFDSQLQDEKVSVFAEQILTAKSWYKGRDSNSAEDIFADMVNAINNNQATIPEAVSLAVRRINQTLR